MNNTAGHSRVLTTAALVEFVLTACVNARMPSAVGTVDVLPAKTGTAPILSALMLHHPVQATKRKMIAVTVYYSAATMINGS
jgi:hypothetical protein